MEDDSLLWQTKFPHGSEAVHHCYDIIHNPPPLQNLLKNPSLYNNNKLFINTVAFYN